MNCLSGRVVALAIILFVSASPALALDDRDGPPAVSEDAATAPKADEPKSSWQFRPRWRLQYDIADVDGPPGLEGSGRVDGIRRAQLGFQLHMPDGLSARLEGEFSADRVQIVDAYLAWDGEGITVTAGHYKAFTPLDDMTSDLNSSFLERASFSTAFGYGRRTGISAGFSTDEFGINGGIFIDPLMMLDDVETSSISGDFRTYWSPAFGKAKLHLGAAYHVRDMKDFEFAETRYALRPQIAITDARYIGTPPIQVSKEQRYGLEAASVWGRWHGAVEVHWLKASRNGLPDPTYFGGYVEAGVFLTKDSRPLEGGQFGAITPAKPFGGGGIGSVQVNVRYDYLDLNDKGVIGGQQNGYLASLIWTPIENLRLTLQYSKLRYDDADVAVAGSRSYTVNVTGVRGQVSF